MNKLDPENYGKMCVPFENGDAANEALKKFYDEVAESRKKHNLADVLIVVSDSAYQKDKEVGGFMADLFCGDGAKKEGMAAWAYGQAAQERKDAIGKYLNPKN